jgi:peptidoglycan hydrolase CwlO-like protein
LDSFLATLFAGALVSLVAQFARSIRHKTVQRQTIQDRIGSLTKALGEATTLISHIESEIQARSALAEQLQKDIDEYNKITELKKPEVEAVAQLLRGELQKEGRSTFWKGFALNFVFFILGAAVSIIITFLAK